MVFHVLIHLYSGEQSPDGSAANTSLLSAYSDEGLDLSQKISESLFIGPNLDPDVDEVVTQDKGRPASGADNSHSVEYILS